MAGKLSATFTVGASANLPLTGGSALTASTLIKFANVLATTGGGTLSVSTLLALLAQFPNLSGSGAMTGATSQIYPSTMPLAGGGTLAIAVAQEVALPLAGDGTLDATTKQIYPVAANFSSDGGILAADILPASQAVLRIDENVAATSQGLPGGSATTGVYVTLIGGGGGGGGPRSSNSATTARPGGAGGGGGAKVGRSFIPVASLGATYSVARGLGGGGGTDGGGGSTNGTPGTAGGASTFSSGSVSLTANGGGGGPGGAGSTVVGAAGGTASVSGASPTTAAGTAGGNGASTTATVGAGVNNTNGAGAGGGGGGGKSASNVQALGKAGGNSTTGTGGPAGAAAADGVSAPDQSAGNPGPGGGGASCGSSSNVQYNGGDGGNYGGGGGGTSGGALTTSVFGGNGGDGYTKAEWVVQVNYVTLPGTGTLTGAAVGQYQRPAALSGGGTLSATAVPASFQFTDTFDRANAASPGAPWVSDPDGSGASDYAISGNMLVGTGDTITGDSIGYNLPTGVSNNVEVTFTMGCSSADMVAAGAEIDVYLRWPSDFETGVTPLVGMQIIGGTTGCYAGLFFFMGDFTGGLSDWQWVDFVAGDTLTVKCFNDEYEFYKNGVFKFAVSDSQTHYVSSLVNATNVNRGITIGTSYVNGPSSSIKFDQISIRELLPPAPARIVNPHFGGSFDGITSEGTLSATAAKLYPDTVIVSSVHSRTMSLPTHAVGDHILLWVGGVGTLTPIPPAPGGTVPVWKTLLSGSGIGTTAPALFYAEATATNHTPGTFTNASGAHSAVVLRNLDPVTPFGARAFTIGAVSGSGCVVPALPGAGLLQPNGTSEILMLHFTDTQGSSSWSAAPSGYTRVGSPTTGAGAGVCVNSKNDPTTDGTATNALSLSTTGSGGQAQIECLHGGDAPSRVMTKPLVVGGNVTVVDNNIAIPAHQIGDLILIISGRTGVDTQPTKPAAGGTVPAWVDIDTHDISGTTTIHRSAYFVATATNHTSGIWTNANAMAVLVIRGQTTRYPPIGDRRQTAGTAGSPITAPAVNLSRTDNSSLLLHVFLHASVTGWGAAPTGYTHRVTSFSTRGILIASKDDTTTDGACAQAFSGSSAAYCCSTIEVLA